MSGDSTQIVDGHWITFPGGELEGKRPNALCPACREGLRGVADGPGAPVRWLRALCFQCYRAQPNRQQASPQRFQFGLPFEPVNKLRLETLKGERATARATMMLGAGRYIDRRRRAQIAARHALDAIAAGLNARPLVATERDRVMRGALHAAELQLPESWLPFVVAR